MAPWLLSDILIAAGAAAAVAWHGGGEEEEEEEDELKDALAPQERVHEKERRSEKSEQMERGAWR